MEKPERYLAFPYVYDLGKPDLKLARDTDWTGDFKLNAPYRTIVDGHVENGKITRLNVTPKYRGRGCYYHG
jgi:hypothetical protein